MTPHGVISDIRTASEAGHARYWHSEMLIEAVQMIATAVHFEFGAAKPLLAHVQFGHDLLSRGLFRLPFTTIFLTGETIPHTGVCMRQTIEGDYLKRLEWFTCAPARSTDLTVDYAMPSLWGELVVAEGEVDLVAHGTVNWKSMTVDPHRSRKTGRVWSVDDYHEASEKVLNFVEGAISFLMSKDIEARNEPPPEKLNRRRLAQGKFPIGPRFVVRIKPEYRETYRRAAASEGSHAGPIMHFRRGHFRTLAQPRKRDGEQIVPVAPTIVGARDDAKPIAKRYEVQS